MNRAYEMKHKIFQIKGKTVVGPPFAIVEETNPRNLKVGMYVALDVVLTPECDYDSSSQQCKKVTQFYNRLGVFESGDKEWNDLSCITFVGKVEFISFSKIPTGLDKIGLLAFNKNARSYGTEAVESDFIKAFHPDFQKLITLPFVFSWFYVKNVRRIELLTIDEAPLTNNEKDTDKDNQDTEFL